MKLNEAGGQKLVGNCILAHCEQYRVTSEGIRQNLPHQLPRHTHIRTHTHTHARLHTLHHAHTETIPHADGFYVCPVCLFVLRLFWCFYHRPVSYSYRISHVAQYLDQVCTSDLSTVTKRVSRRKKKKKAVIKFCYHQGVGSPPNANHFTKTTVRDQKKTKKRGIHP